MSNEFSHEFQKLFFIGLEEVARATGFEPEHLETGSPFPDQIEVLLKGAYIYAVNSLTE